jgi:AraC-like DNA-binding protein
VVEKLIIRTPFRYVRVFPNEACFLHFKSDHVTISSSTEKTKVSATESIVLNCGTYFADLVQHVPDGIIETIALHLHPDLLREIYSNELLPTLKTSNKNSTSLTIKRSPVFAHFADGLNIYFENPALVTADLLMLKIKELILLLRQTENSASIEDLFGQLFTPREANLKDIMRVHLFSDLTISELASLSGRSLSSFKREFRTVFKETPANYIQKRRVERAQQLLEISTLTVAEICFQVGFNDVSHFSKVFKKNTGVNPTTYRNRTHDRDLD